MHCSQIMVTNFRIFSSKHFADTFKAFNLNEIYSIFSFFEYNIKQPKPMELATLAIHGVNIDDLREETDDDIISWCI